MLAPLRNAFNAAFSVERYDRYCAKLGASLGAEVGFRLAETPTFFGRSLAERCASAATEIVTQLAQPERHTALSLAVPDRFAGGDIGSHDMPQFAVIDFAIVRDARGSLVPQLVELQGFPSLLAFEVLQSDAWLAELASIEGMDRNLSPYFSGFDRAAFLALARRTLLGDASPEETVLLDVDPAMQKTNCDFVATRKLFGIEACDPRGLSVSKRRLYRRDAAGRNVRVTRIYNRMVGDDLLRPELALPFDVRDDLGVTWAPHPRWFWAWSKAALPYIEHPSVPHTRVLSNLDTLPEDLETNYVLKPLFSFAGSGVNLQPTRADIDAIPQSDRSAWCLQEKIVYEPALKTPDGDGVKVEVRVMLLRPDAASALVPAINLVRLSRGAMIGVDFNRERTWVGSSVGLW